MAGWETEKIKVENRVDTSPNTYMQRTIDALNKGRYEDALEEAKKAVAYGKGELVYHVLLVRVVFTMKRYAGCLNYLVKSGLWNKRNDNSLRPDEKKYLRYVYRVCCQKCNLAIPDDLYEEEETNDRYTYADGKKQATEKKEVKKKTIKVPKKEQKVFHTKRNILISFITMCLSLFFLGYTGSEPGASLIGQLYLLSSSVFFVTLWFGFLRLIYKQAGTMRLWDITFTICMIVLFVGISFSGVALVFTPRAIVYCVRGLLPTNDDLGLEVIEVEEKPIFENAQIVRSEQITEEQYQREMSRMEEIRAAKSI